MDYSSKRAGETEVFTMDFVRLLGVNEFLLSAVVTVEVIEGFDASPNSMINGIAQVNAGSKILQSITGGIPDVYYRVIFTATTSLGQVLILIGNVRVLR
jgi:hypothetical protein